MLDGTTIKEASKVGPMVILAEKQICNIKVEDIYENSDEEEDSDEDDDGKSNASVGHEVDHQEGDMKRELGKKFIYQNFPFEKM